MRFGQSLVGLMVPEWRDIYLDYRTLKIYVDLIRQVIILLEVIDKFTNTDKKKDKKNKNKSKNKQTKIEQNEDLGNRDSKQDSLANITNLYKTGRVGDGTSGVIIVQETHSQQIQSLKQDLIDILDRLHNNFARLKRTQIALAQMFTHMKYIELKQKFQYYIWLTTQYRLLDFSEDRQIQTNLYYCQLLQYLFIETSYLTRVFLVVREAERKILKKHKKIAKGYLETPSGIHRKLNRLERNSLQLLHQIEDYYTSIANGPSKEAREYIRSIAEPSESQHTDSFLFGLWVGTGATILAFIIAIVVINGFSIEQATSPESAAFTRDFPVWRGLAFFIFYIWILSFNIWAYERFYLNHRLIFKFQDHHASTSTDMFKIAGTFTTIFLVLFLIYVLELTDVVRWGDQFPSYYLMLFGWGALILFLIMPLPILNHRGRLYVARVLYWSVCAPCLGVVYPVIFFTDQFVSLANPVSDAVYSVCFYTQLNLADASSHNSCLADSRAIVTLAVGGIAYSYRILQCLRQGYDSEKYFNTPPFYNTIKYSLSLITVVVAFIYKGGAPEIFALWIIFAATTTLYSFIWDLKIDWGLLDMQSYNKFLRNQIFYPKHMYYFVMVNNFLLRLVWVLTLSPSIVELFGNVQIFALVTGALEIVRRGFWNLLRTQTEQIKNCGKFKALPQTKDLEEKMQGQCLLYEGRDPQRDERRPLAAGKQKEPLYSLEGIRELKGEFFEQMDSGISKKYKRAIEINRQKTNTGEDIMRIKKKLQLITGKLIDIDD